MSRRKSRNARFLKWVFPTKCKVFEVGVSQEMQGFWSALRHVCIRYLMMSMNPLNTYRPSSFATKARLFSPGALVNLTVSIALPPPRLEMEAQLLAARGRRAGVRVAAAQRRGAARILRREWDSTWWNPRGGGLQTPVFAGFPAVRRRANGTARVEKPAFSGLSGIAMKNGGAYRSSAYSRTHVATRIFEHYELAPMRSGMVVTLFCASPSRGLRKVLPVHGTRRKAGSKSAA